MSGKRGPYNKTGNPHKKKRGPYNAENTRTIHETMDSTDNENNEDSSDEIDQIADENNEDFIDISDDEDEDEELFPIGTNHKETTESNLNEPLYIGARLCLATSILLIITFIIQNKLTGDGIKQLLLLVELHCLSPNLFRRSILTFHKIFRELRSPVQLHYYCNFCSTYFKEEKQTVCRVCGEKNVAYFLVIPIISQLASILNRPGILENLKYPVRRKKPGSGVIDDVVDGELYTNIFKDGYFVGSSDNMKEEIHMSFQMNTDGVSLFRSSKFSIWPIYLTINELPPKLRYTRDNRLFVGLWFGYSKPDMDIFLKPLVEEVRHLYHTGTDVVVDAVRKTVKAVILTIVCDSPARSALQNFVQFNGFYGCGTCLEKGESAKTTKGSTMSYPYNISNDYKSKGYSKERTHEDTLNKAKEAVKANATQQGVKGLNVLYLIPKFNIIRGVAIDYMHCVALGVMKMLMHLWLDSSNKAEDFFLGDKMSIINDRLLRMTPPYFVTRAPRILQDLCYWKASEFRTFLLFYSVPCLYGILPDEYFQHLLYINQAIYILLQSSISLADLKTAQKMLCKFCASIDFLYGKRYERSNVHGLLHLTWKVKDLGPLWAHSCFFYEDLNGDLRSLFHGTQKLPLQISSAVLIHQHIPLLANCLKLGTSAADIYCCMTNKYFTKSKYIISGEIYAVGAVNACLLSDHLLSQLVEREIILSTAKFYKLIKDDRVYHSKAYKRVMVRDSCNIRYFDDYQINYGQIQYFLKVESSVATHHYAVVYKLNPVKSNMLLPVHMQEVIMDENSCLVAVVNIVDQCMMMKMRDQSFVASFPNVLEKD